MSVMTWSKDLSDSYILPTARVIRFCNYLRENGIRTTAQDAVLLIEVLGLSDVPMDGNRVEQLWRPIVCQSLRDWRLWSILFQGFWFPHTLKGTVKVTGSSRRTTTLQEAVEKSKSMGESAPGESPHVGDNPGISNQESVSEKRGKSAGGSAVVDPPSKDRVSSWMPSDLVILERLARTIRGQLVNVPTRRWASSDRGRFLDLKRTTQSMIRLGGDGIIPCWQKQRRESPNIVMAIDVSRSMECYAEFYLRLARAFSRWLPIRVFVFHVRCAEVTNLLVKDNHKVHNKITTITAGFQGGTKIASSLKQICFDADGVNLNRRTRLWVFSDGFDTEDPGALRDVLKRVRGRGTTIDWFYPNKTVAGMSRCVQLSKPLVKSWFSAANLIEIEQSTRHMK